jgi:hypothetical protein
MNIYLKNQEISDFCRENKNKSINDEIKDIEVKDKSKITKNKKLSKLDAISKNGISLTIE